MLNINDTSGTGASGTVSLNGGPTVAFTNTDTDLSVTGPLGETVFINTTAITPGFNGNVDITAAGTLSTDAGTSETVINFSANQIVTNNQTGQVTNIDSSAIRRVGVALAWALDTRHREVAMKNLRLAFPKLPESRRRQLAQKAFQQAGRTAMEMLWSTSLDDRTLQEIAVFEGREHLEAAIGGGRGALITTAHFGNWELMGSSKRRRVVWTFRDSVSAGRV